MIWVSFFLSDYARLLVQVGFDYKKLGGVRLFKPYLVGIKVFDILVPSISYKTILMVRASIRVL